MLASCGELWGLETLSVSVLLLCTSCPGRDEAVGESYLKGVSRLDWALKEDERWGAPDMLLVSRALDAERET